MTALLAPCLAAAGLGIVGAVGAACLAAMFAVVLLIVSLSVLAACIGLLWQARMGGVARATPAISPSAGRAAGRCAARFAALFPALFAALFTGILSVSARYWPFGRAPPDRARRAVTD
ncbi:hypothetical protein [Pseudoduganella armeniaca]|nr:hypothetical protein [Pseudoduganella armeniaca]